MSDTRYHDPRSVAGKRLHVSGTCQILVVGAGPAGIAAAIEAAGRGAQVVLADENPIPFVTMGEDVPLHFGGGMSALARNRNAMMDAFVASDPAIERAFEAGVDVRLGTAVWGIYGNGESVGWLPGLLAGLSAEGEGSTLLRCERIVVASGRRDMGLAFPGWDKPGVMGAAAAERLATRYGALAATTAVILGTSAEALATARLLRNNGVRIAAIVEQADAPIGPDELVRELAADGTEILTRHAVRQATGRDGVEAVLVRPLGLDGAPMAETVERGIACNAVILGIGTVPVIELLDALGCRIAFQPGRGGHALVLGGAGRTSVAHVWAAGDAAGTWAEKSLDSGVAEAEGRAAGADAAASLGLGAQPPPLPHAEVLRVAKPRSTRDRGASFEADLRPAPQDEEVLARETPGRPDPEQSFDLEAYRLAWVRANVVDAAGEPHVCLCEEVTAREILEVRPPRYLGAAPDRRNDRSLRALLGDGTPHPDQVKRLTRAGMGPCQGRRCREQVACLLALGAGVPLREVRLAGYRAPVRPLPLAAAADLHEPAEMTAQWDTWFGIAPQYRLADELPPLYTVASGKPAGPAASE